MVAVMTLRRLAATLALSSTLSASETMAQGRGLQCGQRLLNYFADEPVPEPADPSGDPSSDVRRLDLLRQRVRSLRAVVLVDGYYPAVEARAGRLAREGCAVFPLLRRALEARNAALTIEALVIAGEAFEHVGEQLRDAAFHVQLTPAHACAIRRAQDELDVARAAAPPPAPPPPGNPVTICRLPQDPPTRELSEPEDLYWMDRDAAVSGEVAVAFYVRALRYASHHGLPITASIWRAVDRLQDEHNRSILRDRYPGHTGDAMNALLAMGSPGETLLETQPLGPTALAP